MLIRPTNEIVPGSMKGLHQFIPFLSPGTIYCENILTIQRFLRSHGLMSEIFVESPGTANCGEKPFDEHNRFADQAGMLYHLVEPSDIVYYLYSRPEPLMVYYYGIVCNSSTQSFGWAELDRIGFLRTQALLLTHRTCRAISSDAKHDLELTELGFGTTEVVDLGNDRRIRIIPSQGVPESAGGWQVADAKVSIEQDLLTIFEKVAGKLEKVS